MAREEAEDARSVAIRRGELLRDVDSEAFDVRWPLHERGLTRKLIEAEAAYRAAQKAVADAGLGGGDEASSGAGGSDGEGDASDPCVQQNMLVAVSVARITQWLSAIPSEEMLADAHAAPSSAAGGLDAWDVAALDLGDSISQIIEREEAAACNPRRGRIDGWRAEQEGMAAKIAWMSMDGAP